MNVRLIYPSTINGIALDELRFVVEAHARQDIRITRGNALFLCGIALIEHFDDGAINLHEHLGPRTNGRFALEFRASDVRLPSGNVIVVANVMAASLPGLRVTAEWTFDLRIDRKHGEKQRDFGAYQAACEEVIDQWTAVVDSSTIRPAS